MLDRATYHMVDSSGEKGHFAVVYENLRCEVVSLCRPRTSKFPCRPRTATFLCRFCTAKSLCHPRTSKFLCRPRTATFLCRFCTATFPCRSRTTYSRRRAH